MVGACALGAAGDPASDQGRDRSSAVSGRPGKVWMYLFREETVDAVTLVPRQRVQEPAVERVVDESFPQIRE